MVNLKINGRKLTDQERKFFNHQEEITRHLLSDYVKNNVGIALPKNDIETLSHNIAFLSVCDFARVVKSIEKAIYG